MHLNPQGKGAAAPGKNAAPSFDTLLANGCESLDYTGQQPFPGGLREQLASHGFTLHTAGGPDLVLTGAAVGVLPDLRSGWALLRQLRRFA